jgi:hypothetical protein
MKRVLPFIGMLAGVVWSSAALAQAQGLPPAPNWIKDPAGEPLPAAPPPETAAAQREPAAAPRPTRQKAKAAQLAQASPDAGVGGPTSAPAVQATSGARVLNVGPGQPFGTIAEAATAARDGSTVIIHPGEYRECAVWPQNNLTIRAAKPGTVQVRGIPCQGKAAFVIQGANVLVEGLIFGEISVPDGNGAGIRAEGTPLTVRRSVFEDSEQGILARPMPGGVITIENVTFQRLGNVRGSISHGIYVNALARLIIRNSLFRDIRLTHLVKSRGSYTEVTNTILNGGGNATSSCLIDLSNGGDLLVDRVTMIKGPKNSNRTCAIQIAPEGLLNKTSSIRILNSVFENKMGRPVVFLQNRAFVKSEIRNVRFTGDVTPSTGPAE